MLRGGSAKLEEPVDVDDIPKATPPKKPARP
jgi:hypothetical protein